MKIRHKEPHGPHRAAEYPPVGDQLDAIVKLVDHLRRHGMTLPSEVVEWVNACNEVKRRYPRSSFDANQPA